MKVVGVLGEEFITREGINALALGSESRRGSVKYHGACSMMRVSVSVNWRMAP